MERALDEEQVDYQRFARNVHSQAGEDGIIAALLERLPERDHWLVEFGAWDGLVASNSAALIAQGDSAVLIEGSTKRHRKLAARYRDNPSVHPIHAMVGWTAHDGLDHLLSGTPIPRKFDLLSIDIDGNDYHVWEAVTAYRPKIVVVEFNPTIANGIDFVQEPDPAVHQGSSITALTRLANDKGYDLVATTDFNGFFVRRDLFPAFGVADNSVERLRTDTSWQSQIFFGFDGRAMLRGGKGLYWHGVPLPSEIRMVPRPFVGWPGDFVRVRKWAWQLWTIWKYVGRRLGRARTVSQDDH